MATNSAKACGGAARRGQIIQRVLVDGWSARRAASAFDVEERQVLRWLVDYRRRGMASLREDTASEAAPRRLVARLRAAAARLLSKLRGGVAPRRTATCVALSHRQDDTRSRR